METRWLRAEDYDQLLEMLNFTFGTEYKKEIDFLSEQPKMWVRDDERMGKHLGIFDGEKLAAVIGIYLLPCRIGDVRLDFYTTGNVATLPEYEGRGYFTELFGKIMDELEKRGADGARLGGSRVRYGRYGFEAIRAPYTHTFTEHNRIKGLKNIGEDIEFCEISRSDVEALRYCDELSRKADIYVERSDEDNYRDVYLALTTKHATPYLAKRCGKPIGYLAAHDKTAKTGKAEFGPNVAEWRVEQNEDAIPMMSAWQRVVGATISFSVPLTENPLQKEFLKCTENCRREAYHRFKILSYDKFSDAMIKLMARKESLPEIDYVIGIEDWGNLLIHCSPDEAYCKKTDRCANVKLSRVEATRLLFGESDPLAVADVPPLLRSVLPFPFCWCTLDYT